jgi:hypothetical protein
VAPYPRYPPGCPHRNKRPLKLALAAKEGKKTPPGFTDRAPAALPFSADRIDQRSQFLHVLPLHLHTPFRLSLTDAASQPLLFTKSRGTAASIRAESIATDGDNMAAFSASNKKDLNLTPPSTRPPERLLYDALTHAGTRHREEFPGGLASGSGS